MKNKKNIRFLLVLTLFALTPIANSDPILLAGNTDQSRMSRWSALGNFVSGSLEKVVSVARPFKTNDQRYQLEYIQLGGGVTHKFGSGELSLSVFSDDANLPNSPINNGYFFASAFPSSIHNPLSPSQQIVLEADTTYWLVLSADQSLGETRYDYQWNASDAFSSDVNGAELPGLTSAYFHEYGNFNSPTEVNFPVDIYVSPIPEPSTISFLAIASFGIYLFRKRIRK